MKRVIAYISLILYIGYANGILLKTYNQASDNSCSQESYTAYCFPGNAAEFADTSSDSQLSMHRFFTFDALTTTIGKIKLPDASSSRVITATFTISPYEVVYNSAVTDPAQLHTQPAAIFLQNRVLLL